MVTVPANRYPGVLLSDVARQKYPRVSKTETRKANDIIKSGTQFRKNIAQTIHSGTVINCNKDTKKYTIQYFEGYYNKMRHRELVKRKCTTDKNAVSRLKRRQEKQQVNTTIQQATAEPLPQDYAHAVWDYEELRMLQFKHLLNYNNP